MFWVVLLSSVFAGLFFGNTGIRLISLIVIGVLFNPFTLILGLIIFDVFKLKGK